MTKLEYADYEESVAKFIGNEKISFLSTGTGDDNSDPWFSKWYCECCRSPLAGMREYLFARDENNIKQTYEICENCVYYINYGRLDDITMLEIETNK